LLWYIQEKRYYHGRLIWGGIRVLKRTYWKVVKGLPVFLHFALVYSVEKVLTWKVNLGRDPGAEEQILEGSKRVACFFTFCFGIFSRKGVNMEG